MTASQYPDLLRPVSCSSGQSGYSVKNGALYRDVMRTWIYLSDILDWYASFNKRKGSDEFDDSIMSRSRGEPGIACQQRCVKGFCQSNIGCVVGRNIVAEFPDSG